MTRQGNMLAIAIGALSVGVLLYLLDRQHTHVYFIPNWLPQHNFGSGFFGNIGNYLPTFIHVYAFILLTAVIAARPITKLVSVCLAWFIIDSLLEVAQLDSIAEWIAAHTPHSFSGIPFLENTAGYFLSGTFDKFDILSIAAGSIAAYLTAYQSQARPQNETRE